MTIVEFFDRTPIENMVSCLAIQPDRIIFVGDRKKMERQKDEFERFLNAADVWDTRLVYCSVDHNSLCDIVDKLIEIVQEYPDCSFDLTGGDELCLVAVGIVSERLKDQHVQLHRFNISSGQVYDCDQDGQVVEASVPDLTVEQNIILNGGIVSDATERLMQTSFFEPDDDDYLDDLETLWRINSRDCGLWNYQCTMLGRLEQMKELVDDELVLCVSIEKARQELDRTHQGLNLQGILPSLRQAGMITDYSEADGYLHFRYKNPVIKNCLYKAGNVLELYTFLTAKLAVDSEGKYVFSDGMNGVIIDWDGAGRKNSDSFNEIDVLLMRGMIPVFVSCKNGDLSVSELYKLNSVAEHFGGGYARKILVGTTMGGPDRCALMTNRADDMGIRVISGVHQMSQEEFSAKLVAAAL